MTALDQRIRLRIRVYGIVQGIGFRPFVARLADECKICGSVCNKGSFVEIFAEGSREAVFSFYKALPERAPAVSAIVRIDQKELPPEGAERFLIIKSSREAGEIFVSPDLAICPACRKELFDPSNKRYLHPFINCTDCGPRLTILDSMPYDRVRTSMGVFPMCPDCEREYKDPRTRRFHAQPVCCNDCGPKVYIPGREETGPDAIRLVRKVIREGGIAAIKGIGGFHLCCDATSDSAVARLRALKHRPAKPFAVMMRDIGTVERECEIPEGFRGFLEGVQKPILILDRKDGGRISPLVAPDNPTVGVMLPYAPIQMLLFSYPEEEAGWADAGEKSGCAKAGEESGYAKAGEESGYAKAGVGTPVSAKAADTNAGPVKTEMPDAFVMTSGNPSGAPICKDDDEAVRYLSPMCDVILSNDRMIRLRADDSVMQAVRGKPYMIRRSRGYAPLPVVLPEGSKGELLAIGGELKNTFALAKDELVYPSAYIGDLADLRSVNALSAAVERMEELLETKPRAVVCDLHPRYNSSAFAEELSLPVIRIQHHFAHVLSCMAENRWTDPCIGISFDGTGYGTDGTVWGGEFLIASPDHFVRAGSLRPFIQSGGDLASREGWRIAVSLLYDAAESDQEAESAVRSLGLCTEAELKMQTFMRRSGVNSVQSTSAGRVFDAVSAMLGIRRASTFEGEASMALEFAAESWLHSHDVEAAEICGMPEAEITVLNTEEILPEEAGGQIPGTGPRFAFEITPVTEYIMREMRSERGRTETVGRCAYVFHEFLAQGILRGAEYIREQTGISTAALSGGCFQNLLLLERTRNLLEEAGFQVLVHSLIPANDGGIALGQAYYGMSVLQRTMSVRPPRESGT